MIGDAENLRDIEELEVDAAVADDQDERTNCTWPKCACGWIKVCEGLDW